jgi:pimeloyl-ACP methyl ester carboxylesterase
MARDKMLPLRTPKLEHLPIKPLAVTAPDGLNVAAFEWGNPAGPEIVFIHGFSQCHLSWRRQMYDPALTENFRMVAYDLRGHGSSGQPTDHARYRDEAIWADDLKAVMDAASLKRPALVAWSYGGRVVGDYVRRHGQERIAAVNYVAAVTKSDRRFVGPELKQTMAMASDDLVTNIRAARKFVHACFAGRPGGEDMDTVLSYTMAVPAKVRAAVLDRTRDTGETLKELRMPVLITHGTMDRIIAPAAATITAELVPGAKISWYDSVGHSPFWEDAPRFNRELVDFVRGAQA